MHETLNFIIHAFYYDNIHLEAYLKHQYCLVRCDVFTSALLVVGMSQED